MKSCFFFTKSRPRGDSIGFYFFFLSLLRKDSADRDWSETSNPRREGHQGSGDTEVRHPCGSRDGGSERASGLWELHSTPGLPNALSNPRREESSSHFPLSTDKETPAERSHDLPKATELRRGPLPKPGSPEFLSLPSLQYYSKASKLLPLKSPGSFPCRGKGEGSDLEGWELGLCCLSSLCCPSRSQDPWPHWSG